MSVQMVLGWAHKYRGILVYIEYNNVKPTSFFINFFSLQFMLELYGTW
ncbi:hypothetical protein ALO84_200065 [Pseudomonas syringae pv. maculicola]|nr:hypothetical protein ALO84_200065 [Pseudomonas syringae pv. maculicola]RML71153.1 hypothetical protein ALQ91_200161 [Pseudomonas syringae pv. syringae]